MMTTVATKEQERQAIAKIRKIVEGLGENSYVGTAMEGVLEVAEQNIDSDAAFSLKGEVEVAEKRRKEQSIIAQRLNMELEELKEKYEKLESRHQEARERIMKQLLELQAKKDQYEMPEKMFADLQRILEETLGQAEKSMDEAAVLMAGYVGEDNVSENIHDAAKKFREQRSKAALCKVLREELIKRYGEEERRNESI